MAVIEKKIGEIKNTENKMSEISHIDDRIELIREAWKDLGEPYLYGGETDEDGGDCSGKVQTWLRKIPGLYSFVPDRCAYDIYLFYKSHGCRDLTVVEIKPGCLTFFGRTSRISHIKLHTHVVRRQESIGTDIVEVISHEGIDAGGGGSEVTNREEARRAAAGVRISSSIHHGSLRVKYIIDPFEIFGF
jgi:hypothetical protein